MSIEIEVRNLIGKKIDLINPYLKVYGYYLHL